MYFFLGIHFFQHKEQYLVIVDGYHIVECTVMMNPCLIYLFRQFFGCLHGYFHRKTATFAFLALQPYRAAEHCHDTLNDGKSQSEAVFCSGVCQTLKRAEHPLLFLFGHTCARIFDDKFQDTVIVVCCQRNATVLRELDGV